jgi:hypothetical protein
LYVGVGDWAAFRAASEGCEVGGVRSGRVSSEEPPPLLHLAFDLLDFRLLLRACFWGVVSPPETWVIARESREECEVNSERDSVVVLEEPELAMTLACVCAGATA